ncbi:MAG: pilin [Oscillospiraceae bacterium]|nr:pilin [Oscillospiraceae bacterium]
MYGAFNSLVLTAAAAAPDLGKVVSPITTLLETIFTVAIPLVGAIGAIYCILLGLKLAKADEQQDREKSKHALKNAIIGFVLIFVLVVALRIGLPIMSEWADSQTATQTEAPA